MSGPLTRQIGPIEPDLQIGRPPGGRGFRLEAALVVPQPRERVFALFSDASQLERLTPDSLHFAVLTPLPIRIAAGTRIDYRLRVRGIPLRWQSLISVWEPPARFVDEQTKGPYRRWRHEHRFEEVEGGTLCRDIVDYEVPGGPLINVLFVRPDLINIFTFRQRALRELFAEARDA